MEHMPIKIMIADDNELLSSALYQFLKAKCYDVCVVSSGHDALERFACCDISIVIVDINLGDMSGLDVMSEIKRMYPPCQIIVITGCGDESKAVQALRSGACDYIAKPFNMEILAHSVKQCIEKFELMRENSVYQKQLEELVKQRTSELEEMNVNLKQILVKTVESLSRTVEIRDPYTYGHMTRVAELACKISDDIGMDSKFRTCVKMAGSLHDIGKLYVPHEILSKPTKLLPEEFMLVKCHCLFGYNILKEIPFKCEIARAVKQHHEKLDGSGYPDGLKGDEISLEAQLLAVCDVVEAIASHRPYRPALGLTEAVDEITRHKGTKFNVDFVNSCINVITQCDYDLEEIFRIRDETVEV